MILFTPLMSVKLITPTILDLSPNPVPRASPPRFHPAFYPALTLQPYARRLAFAIRYAWLLTRSSRVLQD